MSQPDVKSEHESMDSARKCTLLNVEPFATGISAKSRRAIITLGGDDGTIDRIIIDARDGVRLVERLAFAFRKDQRPPGTVYGTGAWFARRSVLRAEVRVESDVEHVYEFNKRGVHDVVEYMDEELSAMKRILSRRGRTAAAPETLLRRIRCVMLVLIDAMRLDR